MLDAYMTMKETVVETIRSQDTDTDTDNRTRHWGHPLQNSDHDKTRNLRRNQNHAWTATSNVLPSTALAQRGMRASDVVGARDAFATLSSRSRTALNSLSTCAASSEPATRTGPLNVDRGLPRSSMELSSSKSADHLSTASVKVATPCSVYSCDVPVFASITEKGPISSTPEASTYSSSTGVTIASNRCLKSITPFTSLLDDADILADLTRQ